MTRNVTPSSPNNVGGSLLTPDGAGALRRRSSFLRSCRSVPALSSGLAGSDVCRPEGNQLSKRHITGAYGSEALRDTPSHLTPSDRSVAVRARRAPVAVALLAALSVISACSGSDGAAEPSITSATTSATPETASTSPASSSVGASIAASSPASSAPTASSLVQPITLTTEQIEAYTGATMAFQRFTDVVDKAFAQPENDWSKELSDVAADPLLSEISDQLKTTAAAGEHWTGLVALDYGSSFAGPVEVNLSPGGDLGALVTFQVCIDTRNQDYLDKNGTSQRGSNQGEAAYRVPAIIKAAKFAGDRWLIGDQSYDQTRTC